MTTPKQNWVELRSAKIEWLKLNNYPALPVTPAQDPYQYPKTNKNGDIEYEKDGQTPKPLFTGKNPSYLDRNGVPHLINHSEYQNRLPNEQELETWFANPINGVGTLGGWNNTVWLDIDVKQFESEEDCLQTFTQIAENPELANTFIERSHSGGWRIGVRVKQKPDFTNFALEPGGKHIGEALGKGRFTVLAPTIGPSGNPYQSINCELPVEIESLESIGIYTTRSQSQLNPLTAAAPRPEATLSPGIIPLELVATPLSREILDGANPKDDHSGSLATAIQEWYGWQNWGHANSIAFSGSTEELARYSGQRLGIDADRIERIIDGIDATKCTPAAYFCGGDLACWKRIHSVDRVTYKRLCPEHIKSQIQADFGQYREVANGGSVSASPSALRPGKVVPMPNMKGFDNKGDNNDNGDGSAGNGGSGGGNGTTGGNGGLPPKVNAYALVKNLLDRKLSPAQLQGELLELNLAQGYPLNGLQKLVDEIESENKRSALALEDTTELKSLLSYQNETLNLHRVFPKALADVLLSKSESDRVDPAFAYLNVLTALGIQLGGHLAIKGKDGATIRDHWLEYGNLWTLVVGHPSDGKSQTQRAIFGPIKREQSKANGNFRKKLKELEAKEKAWKQKGTTEREALMETDENPEVFAQQLEQKPVLRYIQSGSPEGAYRRMADNPPLTGVGFTFDEITKITKMDQYKAGGGDTRETLLQLWGGPDVVEILRANESNTIVLNQQVVSVSGGIQPAKVPDLMSNRDDADGFLSRFLSAKVYKPVDFAVWSDVKVNINEALSDLYNWFKMLPNELRELAEPRQLLEHGDGIPPTVILHLEPEAQKRWQRWWEELRRGQQKYEVENPAFSSYLGKMLSQTLRLALVLHCLDWRYEGGSINHPMQVTLATLKKAIYAARWHIGQFRLIQADIDETTGLPSDLMKMLDYVARKNAPVSAEQIQNSVFRRCSKKPPVAKIRDWMGALGEMRMAVVDGAGKAMRMVAKPIDEAIAGLKKTVSNLVGNPQTSDTESDNPQIGESIGNSGIEEINNNLSDISDTSSPPLSPPEINEFSDPPQNSRICRSDLEEPISNLYGEDGLRNSEASENQSEAIGASDILEEVVANPGVGLGIVQPNSHLRQVFAPVADENARYTIVYIDGYEYENCLFIGSPEPNVFHFLDEENARTRILILVAPEQFEDYTRLYLQTNQQVE